MEVGEVVEWWTDGKVVLVPRVLEKGFLEPVAYRSLNKVAPVNLQCNSRDMDWKMCNNCKSNLFGVEKAASLA